MLWAGVAIDDAPQTGFMCALSFVYVCRSFFLSDYNKMGSPLMNHRISLS